MRLNLEKKLSIGTKSTGGRNNQGRITSFHRGGGHKRRYRFIDFERNLEDVPGLVLKIKKDPLRSGKIALICYSNGLVSYILAPEGLKEGDCIVSGDINKWTSFGVSRLGSIISLKDATVGEPLSNVELFPGTGGKIARSAGSYVEFIKKYEDGRVLLKLRSNEFRIFSGDCKAMVGVVSNLKHREEIVGKAGKSRWLGKRPTVRGVAMNPVDHPHGGGEGKKSGGNKTPWGKITKGRKTRNKHKQNPLIVKKKIKLK